LSGRKKGVKVALIGCGKNGIGHAEFINGLETTEVVAGVDPSEKALEKMKELFPGIKCYDNHEAMFAANKLDAVIISSYHCYHYEQTMAAFRNSCHVLLEKPMAIKKEHCHEMVKTAKEKKLILQIGFECRLSALYKRVKEIVDSGEVGELLSMSYVHYRGKWLRDWYCQRELAGAMATIETCHYIDLMRFFSGEEVEWVFASSPRANLRTEYDYPDSSFAQLYFQSGLVASIIDSHARSSETFAHSHLESESYAEGEGEYLDPVYGHQFEYSLVGTSGSLWVRMLSKQISVFEKVVQPGSSAPQIVLKRVEDYSKLSLKSLIHEHCELDRQFIESVRTNSPAVFEPEDALKSHLVAFAIDESEKMREKVFINYHDTEEE